MFKFKLEDHSITKHYIHTHIITDLREVEKWTKWAKENKMHINMEKNQSFAGYGQAWENGS